MDSFWRDEYEVCLRQVGAGRIILPGSCLNLRMGLGIRAASGYSYSRPMFCGNRKASDIDPGKCSLQNRTGDTLCSVEL